MTTRATLNHFYSQNDCLGLGATCEVYKGISKDGEIRALKVFMSRADLDLSREINALKNLRHPNIIKFFGIEEELGSGKRVVVMEYCEEGSLLDLINKPENAYGINEDEFLLLLSHLVAGIRHFRQKGFIHRDLKPANILRSIDDEGQSVYKLSDFGTAKPLNDDEFFQSLVGTEEYLHPDIFKAAFFDRDRNHKFDTSADLWSLGATLYHCATGRVPFRPYSGRADKEKMFEMISKKPDGVISGIQLTVKGDVKWSKELPDLCPFSFSLKKCLTKVMASLFETKSQKPYTFDNFFTDMDNILEKEAVIVLKTTSTTSPFTRIYQDTKNGLKDIQEVLETETEIKVSNQKIFHRGICITDTQAPGGDLQDKIRPFTMLHPMILIGHHDNSEMSVSIDPYMAELSENPVNFASTCQPDIDYKMAKKCRDQVALLRREVEKLSVCQQHIIQLRSQLRSKMQDSIKTYMLKAEIVSEIYQKFRNTVESIGHRENLPASFDKTMEQIARELDLHKQGCEKKFVGSQDGSLEENNWCFEGRTCISRFTRWLDVSKSLCSNFNGRRDKRRTSSLDERMSTVEKKQLKEQLAKCTSHWTDHCHSKTKFLFDNFKEWVKHYSDAAKNLEETQEHLEIAKMLLMQLITQVIPKPKQEESLHHKTSKRQDSQSLDSLFSKLIEETKGSKEKAVTLRESIGSLPLDFETPEIFDMGDTVCNMDIN